MVDDKSQKESGNDIDQNNPKHDGENYSADDAQSMTDEEYQFENLDGLGVDAEADIYSESNFDTGGQEGVASSPSRTRFSNLDPKLMDMLKKSMVAIVGVILIVFIYKYTISFFTTKSVQKRGTTAEKSASMPTPKTVQASTTTESSQPVQPKLTRAMDESRGTVSQGKFEKKLNNLQLEISTLSTQVKSMTDGMKQMQQAMMAVNERVEQQSEQMAQVQAQSQRVMASMNQHKMKQAGPKATYYVQAIIPGRAWLISKEGKQLTVSQGSTVPGYGTVKMINPKMGRVFTSSGRVIQYSKADS